MRRTAMLALFAALGACSTGENPPVTPQDSGQADHLATLPDDAGVDAPANQPQDGSAGQHDAPVSSDAPATAATVHDIDVGNVADGTNVTLTGLVVVGVANYYGKTKSSPVKCEYNAFLQDPSGAAPSGIMLFLTTANCTGATDGGTCHCPYPPASGTLLDQVTTLGDVFTVVGTVANYTPRSDAGVFPTQHELTPASLTKTASGATVTPYVVATPAQFAASGTGYQQYESMLVTVQLGSATAVANVDQYGDFDFGGAHFVGDYRWVYDPVLLGDGGVYPTSATTLRSITGVADPSYNGGIAPRQASDFTP